VRSVDNTEGERIEMTKWTPNSDNTDFHLEKSGDHAHCTLSGGTWRVTVWIGDHQRMDVWAGRASETHIEDVQDLAISLLDLYKEWAR